MKFKVGDRVAIYEPFQRRIGWITGSCIDGNVWIGNEPHEMSYQIHSKQCRRLIKKKRREIWVVNTTLYFINNPKYDIYDRKPEGLNATKFIEAKHE